MGRPVILGNGALTVGLNESGLVHDFYYPYVGLDNLTTSRGSFHRIGVFVDGVFSWVDSADWQTNVDFEDTALVSSVVMKNERLHVEFSCQDFVDSEHNVFGRHVVVKNGAATQREIRLFFHQAFEISRGGRGDTALYEPNENYILDYKGRCSLLIYSQTSQAKPAEQFCVGLSGVEGKEGTWRDAEDGNLSGNPVEHGGVDSVLANIMNIESGAEAAVDYWVVAADSQYSAERIHRVIKDEGLPERIAKTRLYWSQWLATSHEGLHVLPEKEQAIARKSLMIIKSHADKRGGLVASCDSSIYNYGRDYYSYVWPRDGAYAMWPLIRLGYTEEPKKFFAFCRDIMSPEGYMMHKYQPDKAIGSTWHPLLHGHRSELAIQEDETAIVIYMLYEFYKESGEKDFVESLYATLVQPMADFMYKYRDLATKLPHASYDLWEEKFLTHTYTTAMVYRALKAAARLADIFEFPDDAVRWRQAASEIATGSTLLYDSESNILRKGFLVHEDGTLSFDNTLDVSSAYAATMFAPKAIGQTPTQNTFEAIEKRLLNQSPSGGSPRYEHDGYFASKPTYKGNPWFVTTLWLAQYYLQVGRDDEAKKLVDWTLEHALPSGALSEQVDPTTGEPTSVLPLVWSHAELINTLLDLYG